MKPSITPAITAHTDFLTITVPYLESADVTEVVLAAIAPALPRLIPWSPDTHRVESASGMEGTLKFKRCGPVFTTSVSGTALTALREADCFADLLWCFHERSHRISHLEAALDVSGIDPPSFMRGLYDYWVCRALRLSQRKITNIEAWFGTGFHGRQTGSVLFGAKDARVRLLVYDKQNQLVTRRNQPDPGPLVRFELKFRGGENAVPFDLGNAANPTAVFWDYMPREILCPPPDATIPTWVKSDAVGYDLPPRSPKSPDEPLRKWVEQIGVQGVAIADKLGKHGRPLLAHLLGISAPSNSNTATDLVLAA
jgi:hypothetical protein